MRGSIVGLSLDSSISDLALKFNVTLEAIALQTRHILDEIRTHGHEIHGIYISGGQAKNQPLMQLLADVCKMPVILPNNCSAAVVLGAAMLGKFAKEVTDDLASRGQVPRLQTQADADNESQRVGERLWDIMVCRSSTSAARVTDMPPGGNDTTRENRIPCCFACRCQAAGGQIPDLWGGN
jgi:ribulose kinase